MTTEINHHAPSLHSDIVGKLDKDTGLALFRGIPYASVEKRWTHSRTNHSLSSPFDARQFGPRCVQQNGPVLVSGGVNDSVPGDDEFKCLNLNICVPDKALPAHQDSLPSSELPVMVWIHGGAFMWGANSVGRYRPQLLSLLAKNSGSPIVLVQIGYRLGGFGFAASNDLASELESDPATNGHQSGALLGNYGLVDQRNAFDWVRSHIRDFGGDPFNVTAFGISAGSASIHYHILAGDPLFDRAILMSGSAPTLGPLPLHFHETAWQTMCKEAKVDAASASERLTQLRALSPEEIAEIYPADTAMGPVADGTLLPSSWGLSEPQAPTRCKEIILGDVGVEGIVMDHLSHSLPQPHFHKLVHSTFSSSAEATAFLQHFNFTLSPNLPYEAYRDALRFLFSVAIFQFPNLSIAESFAPIDSSERAAYYYHFEEPSPYPGPTFGIPYHGQCALFMYQSECATYSIEARKVAEEMGHIWTAFAHGKRPWQCYEKGGCFMRFGPKGECGMEDFVSDSTREYGYLGWLREHFEEVKEFVQWTMLGLNNFHKGFKLGQTLKTFKTSEVN